MTDAVDTRIVKARKELSNLETTTIPHRSASIIGIVDQIHDFLTKAGVDAAALDETGQCTAAQMEERIGLAAARANLVSARKDFSNLETTTIPHRSASIIGIVDQIHDFLTKAGVDAAALDETGQCTAAQMEERIGLAAARANLVSARKDFSNLETTTIPHRSASIIGIVDQIHDFLTKAGVDAAALDETGQCTAAQMEERIGLATERVIGLTRKIGLK